MSLSTRVITGLVAGLLLGLALANGSIPGTAAILAIAAPVGTIFISLIRMTVIPLVASMLVASVGSMAASGALGRVAARAIIVALSLVTVTAVITLRAAAGRVGFPRRRGGGAAGRRPLPARLYGVALSPAQLAAVVFPVMLTTFAVGGIPGGSIIAMVPVLAAVNLPIEAIGILLAVDTIPDMFRTTANVTGSMTVAAVIRKHSY